MIGGFNHWPIIAEGLHDACKGAVAKTAQFITDTYVATAPVDTGFMVSSAYTVTSENSTYGATSAPPGDSYLLPEVDAPPDDFTAYAAVGANYAIYVEMGTYKMAAQPAFIPAVDAAADELTANMSAAIAALGGA